MDFQDKPRAQLQDISALGITCAECGTAIDKLPFTPTKRQDDTYGKLYCYNCNKKRKPKFSGSRFER